MLRLYSSMDIFMLGSVRESCMMTTGTIFKGE